MRTLDAVLDQLAFHPATNDTAPKHAAVREVVSDAAAKLWDLVPDGPEKTLAMRALQECMLWSNTAIALTVPADTAHAATARVLPDDGTR